MLITLVCYLKMLHAYVKIVAHFGTEQYCCQYLVGPPCACTTAYKRLRMLSIKWWRVSVPMQLNQVLCNLSLKSSKLVILNLFNSCCRIAHPFSMGDRSGDCAGQGWSTVTS